jgi:hypothetical protein
MIESMRIGGWTTCEVSDYHCRSLVYRQGPFIFYEQTSRRRRSIAIDLGCEHALLFSLSDACLFHVHRSSCCFSRSMVVALRVALKLS